MRTALILLSFVIAAIAVPTAADAPTRGLLWNRTGLPLVFPLHVRSATGASYYLQLIDPKTGAPALAAWFEGGDLFRVLAPPGEWRLLIARGPSASWRGEAEAFGADTEIIDRGIVSFGVEGFRTRRGVVVDLLGVDT